MNWAEITSSNINNYKGEGTHKEELIPESAQRPKRNPEKPTAGRPRTASKIFTFNRASEVHLDPNDQHMLGIVLWGLPRPKNAEPKQPNAISRNS